jgi:hypothetical protein
LLESDVFRKTSDELFSHRNDRKTFDVKKMTSRSEKNKFIPYNARVRSVVADLVLDLDIEGIFGEVHAFEEWRERAGFFEASHGDFLQMV